MPVASVSRFGPSACTWLERLARCEISSVEMTQQVIDRLEGARALNAVVAYDPELALVAARQADDLRRSGADTPLLGLPVTVKDTLPAAGLPCLSGSLARVGAVAGDATVVARLRAAGAVVAAKTNVPEYAWSYETENVVCGRTNHPFDETRTPGGSSGGEAALLGADASIVGVGTDGGGSIRVPSHYCGTVGLRPTAGLVPETGVWPSTRDTGMLDMSAIGPMARYVEDLALLLPVLAGPDGIDPFVGPAPLAPPATSPLRVAVYEDDGVAHPNAETRAAVRTAARALADAGCTVETVAPPDVTEATELFFAMMAADGGARARADLATAGGRHVPQMARLLDSLEPLALDASGFFGLFARWARLRARVRAFVAPYDVVVAPVTIGAAPLHGCTPGTDTPLENYAVFNFTHTYSVAGLPVAVARAGSQSGLPIGVQLVANPFHDRTALAAAALLQAADPAGAGP